MIPRSVPTSRDSGPNTLPTPSQPAAPQWRDDAAAVVAYVHWLMDRDRKSTGLKSLQGKIWEEGYRAGDLKGEVYPDVPPALERWRGQGIDIAIFSSGSVQAQRSLFSNTAAGDLTRFIRAYFDTTTGPKNAPRELRAHRGGPRALPLRGALSLRHRRGAGCGAGGRHANGAMRADAGIGTVGRPAPGHSCVRSGPCINPARCDPEP